MTDTQQRISASFATQGLMKTIGASLLLVEEGEVRIEMPYATHLSQQRGYVHAGAIASILDSACGYAALTKAPAECDVVTAEFKINLMRPALGERFVAIGRVQNAGRLLTVCTGEVLAYAGDDAPPKVVALMQATIANIRG
ncbi:PaaI family thioesterase [Variovorax sp. KK3]|uniref:PaaI family thioesterase n=1 Tax=Variovorax sp. KK3 TaxID=1855728 RepID=UPI00097BF370|nr:PaaI family thioesterase [Variovorax sp. KK3]